MELKLWPTLLTGILLLLHSCSCEVETKIISANEERNIILQFFNYVDSISRIKLDNMLEMTRTFVEQLLNSIPHDQRGNSAEMLQEFIDQAEQIRRSGNLKEKEDALMQLQNVITTIDTEMVKQEQEDLIITRGLMGTFEFLARLSIEENRFNERFVKASKILHDLFSPEGEQRNAMLFDVLTEIEGAKEIVRWETLRHRFQQVKQSVYGIGEM